MIKFFGKLMRAALIGAVTVLVIRNGCTVKPETTSNSETSSDSVSTLTPDCLKSLPNVLIRKDEDSADVEAEGDKLKGQAALNKYSEARLLYLGELGYATARAMKGDPSASMELNLSIASSKFPFKVGQAFAQTGKHEIAITCFTESLSEKLLPPNDASAYLSRGEAYLATGEKLKARQDYQKSAELFQKYKLPQYSKKATDRLRSITP